MSSHLQPELAELEAARAELLDLIEALPEAALDWRGGDGLWTPRLVLGHLAHGHDFYVMIVEQAREHGFGRVQLRPELAGWETMRETDAAVEEAASVAEVRASFEQCYARLVALVQQLTPEELDREFLFDGWRPDHAPYATTLRRRVLRMAWEHIREHLGHLADLVAAWRAAGSPGEGATAGQTGGASARPPRDDLRGQIARRIQRYLLSKYAGHELVTLPGFTLCFDPDDADVEASVALPHSFDVDALVAELPLVREAFAQRGRRVAIQLIDVALPGLPYRLEQAGLQLHQALPVLVCTPELLRQPDPPAGTTLVMLSPSSSLEAIREGLDANALGFDPEAPPSGDEEAEQFRATLGSSRAFTLRLGGQPAAAGMFIELEDGVTEITGVTTLESFRGQGLGAYLTARIAERAFAHGAELVFLLPASGSATRVYNRVGFEQAGHLCAYHEAQG